MVELADADQAWLKKLKKSDPDKFASLLLTMARYLDDAERQAEAEGITISMSTMTDAEHWSRLAEKFGLPPVSARA